MIHKKNFQCKHRHLFDPAFHLCAKGESTPDKLDEAKTFNIFSYNESFNDSSVSFFNSLFQRRSINLLQKGRKSISSWRNKYNLYKRNKLRHIHHHGQILHVDLYNNWTRKCSGIQSYQSMQQN